MTLRKALDQIDELLLDPAISSDLWAVLTALRGPDDEDYELKVLYTAPLRTAAFPRFSVPAHNYLGEDHARFNKWGVQVGGELLPSVERRPYGDHFIMHNTLALNAMEGGGR